MAFMASLNILLTHDSVTSFGYLDGAFALHHVFASLQDVSVDAVAITIMPTVERGRVNASMKGGMVIGQAVGALVFHWEPRFEPTRTWQRRAR